MKILPAIDIKDKKCVRLVKGNFENKTEYEISPVDQARKYSDHSFKNLHIVDLDAGQYAFYEWYTINDSLISMLNK